MRDIHVLHEFLLNMNLIRQRRRVHVGTIRLCRSFLLRRVKVYENTGNRVIWIDGI